MSTPSRHQSLPESVSAAILVVDDHELARAGLVSMLVGEPDFHVVGEADNGETAIGLCALLHPSLVLMDVRMPGMDGLTATAAIKAQSPTTSVLIVTLYEEQDYLLQAIKAGAAGYILTWRWIPRLPRGCFAAFHGSSALRWARMRSP
jgi:DNA-binding NarL/FixJ family response regulator